jgi:hypothetical protein
VTVQNLAQMRTLPWCVSDRIATLGPQRNLDFEVSNRIGYVQAGDGTSMFLVLWEFEVKPGNEERFELVYGPSGKWAQLFQSDPAYQRTLLLPDSTRELTYLTCDFWDSGAAYENFRRRNRDAYLAIDRECAELTLTESKIGAFERLANDG